MNSKNFGFIDVNVYFNNTLLGNEVLNSNTLISIKNKLKKNDQPILFYPNNVNVFIIRNLLLKNIKLNKNEDIVFVLKNYFPIITNLINYYVKKTENNCELIIMCKKIWALPEDVTYIRTYKFDIK